MQANRVAVLFLTPSCNMHCDFCGADAGFDPIPYERAVELVQRLAREGTQSLVLGGGEPFMWKHDIYRLAYQVRQHGMLVQVGSNATLAPEDNDSLHAFDRWILPIESVSGRVHDQLRAFEGGHLHKVMHLLDRLRRQSIEVTISSLVTKENFDSLMEVGALLKWYQENGGRIHAWHLYRFLEVGRGGSFHNDRFATLPGVFESLGELIKQRFDGLQVYLRPDMYHSRQTSFYWWKKGELQTMQALAAA